MAKLLPTYEEQQNANAVILDQILHDTRPDIFALMKILDDTNINWTVPWKVIEHLHRIATSTKYGKVVVEVENNTVRFVRGEAATKMNEQLIIDENTEVGVILANQKVDNDNIV